MIKFFAFFIKRLLFSKAKRTLVRSFQISIFMSDKSETHLFPLCHLKDSLYNSKSSPNNCLNSIEKGIDLR